MSDDDLSFTEYQIASGATAIYPGAGEGEIPAISYTALGLVNEAGEVAGKVKKIMRDGGGFVTPEKARDIADEIGDVLWYMARLADELDFSLEVIAQNNLDKLNSRKARGVLGGSGDNR